MSATLFFSGSKCTVPWNIVEKIANIQLIDEDHMLAKTIWQFLIELMDIFKHTTFELQECSVQIIVSMNSIIGKYY